MVRRIFITTSCALALASNVTFAQKRALTPIDVLNVPLVEDPRAIP